MLTQEKLKKEFKYDRDTGLFTRLIARGNQYAGTVIKAQQNRSGYVEFRVFDDNNTSRKYKAHRLAWLYEYGSFPESHIDHINHNRADNRISNLREATHKENSDNLSCLRKNTSSGKLGVTWNKRTFKWEVSFRSKYVARYDLFWDAVEHRERLVEEDRDFHSNHGK